MPEKPAGLKKTKQGVCARERAGRPLKWILMFPICFSVLPNNSYTVLGKTIQFLWASFSDMEAIKNDFCPQCFVPFVYTSSKLFRIRVVSYWMYLQCFYRCLSVSDVASRHRGTTKLITWACVFI